MSEEIKASPENGAEERPPLPAPEPVSPAAVAAPPPRASRSAAPVAWLALLVAVAALGGVVFQAYRDRIESDLADFRTQSALQEQVGAINQLRGRLADQRASARNQEAQWQQRLQALDNELIDQRRRIGELQRVDRSTWQLAEAEYLLQLASQRLLLGGDAQSALQMLQQADGIVHSLGDPAALPVRAALADDIAALQAVPAVDVDGNYLAIAATAKQAQGLRLIRPLALEETAGASAEPVPASWRERFEGSIANAFAKLGELVQVRRSDEPFRALLAPEHEAALRHNLQLLFEQAQLALLAGNQRLYEQSLEKARQWLLTYFPFDEAAAQALAENVRELQARPVARQLPDIDASRRALKGYIDGQLRVAPAPASQPAAEQGAPADGAGEAS